MRNYRATHRDAINASALRWYYRNREQAHRTALLKYKRFREFVLSKLECCSRCGNADKRVLQFHHVTGKKEHNISEMKPFPLKKVALEIEKCIVLCANCHAIVEHERRGTPRYQELD